MPRHDDTFAPKPTSEQAEKLATLPHRMQSAVAFLQQHHSQRRTRHQECEPKHLRVGVNSALVETSALARLMLEKKLITAEEYFEALIAQWEREIALYQTQLTAIDPRLSV